MIVLTDVLDGVAYVSIGRVLEDDDLVVCVELHVLLVGRNYCVTGDTDGSLFNSGVEGLILNRLRGCNRNIVVIRADILDRVFDIMLRSPHSVQVVLAVLHCAGVASCELLGTIVFLGRSVFISCPADEGVAHTGEGFGVLERSFLADLEGAASLILLRVSGQITAVGVVDKGVLFLFPLCGELQDAGGFAAVVAAIVQGFFGIAVVSAGHVVAVSVFFIVALNDLDAPALEGVAEALGRRQLDCRAGEFEVVDFSDTVVVDVFDSGHILDFIAASVGVIHHGHEVQIAGQLVTVFVICRIAALVHIVAAFAVVRFVQIRPCDFGRRCLFNARFKCDIGCQNFGSLFGSLGHCGIVEVHILRQRQIVKFKRADGEIAVAVVFAKAETGLIICAQLEVHVFVELRLCQRAERGVHSRVCVDVVRGDIVLEQDVRPAPDCVVRGECKRGGVLLVPLGTAVLERVERIAIHIEVEVQTVQELKDVGAIERSFGVAKLLGFLRVFKVLVDFNVVGIHIPRSIQVRPAVDGLAGDVHGLAFAAPVLERVAFAGRGGSVRGGQGVAIAGRGGLEDEMSQAVICLICCTILFGVEVNDVLIVIDHALDVRPAVDCLL